ncbi:glycosyltransferase family 1 protein [Nocardioides seonyuensis]|uniref:Glycosyltransferase family 1 protein n=1 Tax=Nocardioides seonyuensis TaxID=2518371 RepID=A0A4P7IIZ3_9ACTN|nr:glycosyltransferase family 1 protein [Nocardioides seonyuensis]QBX55851.1 glycosyltransferase family 1 protein [Nocardioides seonyuensis]
MSRPVRFRLLEDGRWSGGGSVLLENAREAREQHPVLQGDEHAVPIMARNVPPMGKFPPAPFVVAPQNAWVWTPVARGTKERTLVTGLRVGTRVTYNRASAVIRISEAVPPGQSVPTSEVLHNVLDRGFEIAADRYDERTGLLCEGAFVCVGSNYSFRDLALLVRAHRAYRAGGGERRLVLMGPVGSHAAEKRLQAELHSSDDSVVRRPESTRAECLSALRSAYAAVCPARVEASPVGVLEAAALSPRVLLSDIVGHRGIVGSLDGAGEPAYFRPHDLASLTHNLKELDEAPAHAWRAGIDTVDARQDARGRWGECLAAFLTGLADSITSEVDKEPA